MTDQPPVRCRRKQCNRVLKDPESIARRIGPVCEEREAWALGPSSGPPPRRHPRRRPRLQGGPDLLDLLKEQEDG